MATIAEQLTSLANTKTAIKDAIVAKGVSVSDSDTFSSYATKIGQISGGGGAPATKFCATVDVWIGDVDANGVLNEPTWTGALNFAGVKEIGSNGLPYAFYKRYGITSVDLSSLQSVGVNGLLYAFYYCSGITGALDLSSLQSVGDYGLDNAFSVCSGITGVDLSSLQSVGVRGLQSAFYGCKKIVAVSFPALTDVQTDSFGSSTINGVFRDCTAMTEIHFRADMQATIEAMSQYANKWGATNATIYFDL